MKCQLKYRWVKLPKSLPSPGQGGTGTVGTVGRTCSLPERCGPSTGGFENPVEPGMWAGGRGRPEKHFRDEERKAALETLEQLRELGYLSYSLDSTTKKLEYTLLDWVCTCTGEASVGESVYALNGSGFLCLPRSIPDRLANRHY